MIIKACETFGLIEVGEVPSGGNLLDEKLFLLQLTHQFDGPIYGDVSEDTGRQLLEAFWEE